MITLAIIVYIIISLRVYYSYKKDNFDDFRQEWECRSSKKEGMITGFSAIPILIVFFLLLIGGVYVMMKLVSWILIAISWVITNMP